CFQQGTIRDTTRGSGDGAPCPESGKRKHGRSLLRWSGLRTMGTTSSRARRPGARAMLGPVSVLLGGGDSPAASCLQPAHASATLRQSDRGSVRPEIGKGIPLGVVHVESGREYIMSGGSRNGPKLGSPDSGEGDGRRTRRIDAMETKAVVLSI